MGLCNGPHSRSLTAAQVPTPTLHACDKVPKSVTAKLGAVGTPLAAVESSAVSRAWSRRCIASDLCNHGRDFDEGLPGDSVLGISEREGGKE